MKLFLHELRMSWKVAFWVNFGTVLLMVVGIMKYTGFEADAGASVELINQFPKVILAVLGMSNLDITTVSGFYGILFFYVVLIGAAYAISLGINTIAREENEQTVEFLLTKPIARWHILATKLAVSVFWLVLFIVLSAVSTLVGLAAINVSDNITQEVLLASLSLLPVLGVYLSVGVLSATFLAKASTGGLLAYSFYALTWLASVFYLMFEQLSWFQYVTPMQFYLMPDLLNLTWSWPLTLYAVVVIGATTTLAFWRYQKLDVRVR